MNSQMMVGAVLAGMLLAGACDRKSPDSPGNPLPPQKPPAPKVSEGGTRLAYVGWATDHAGSGRWAVSAPATLAGDAGVNPAIKRPSMRA